MSRNDILNEYVECTVCGSDTAQLCSPCGDPVCHNCACPNGCEAMLHEGHPGDRVLQWTVEAAA